MVWQLNMSVFSNVFVGRQVKAEKREDEVLLVIVMAIHHG